MFDVICIGAALIDMVARVERHPIEDDEVDWDKDFSDV